MVGVGVFIFRFFFCCCRLLLSAVVVATVATVVVVSALVRSFGCWGLFVCGL
jgi:hypothetical protein